MPPGPAHRKCKRGPQGPAFHVIAGGLGPRQLSSSSEARRPGRPARRCRSSSSSSRTSSSSISTSASSSSSMSMSSSSTRSSSVSFCALALALRRLLGNQGATTLAGVELDHLARVGADDRIATEVVEPLSGGGANAFDAPFLFGHDTPFNHRYRENCGHLPYWRGLSKPFPHGPEPRGRQRRAGRDKGGPACHPDQEHRPMSCPATPRSRSCCAAPAGPRGFRCASPEATGAFR
jgi:hypothetical protein